MRIRKFVYLPLFILPLLLSSCASQSSLEIKNKHTIQQNESFDLDELVDIYPITPSLLTTLNNEKQLHPQTEAWLNRLNTNDLNTKVNDYYYVIGVGDILSITVWEHPELTIPAGSYRSAAESGRVVQADGTIYYPYINKVKVAGKTVDTVRTEVSQLLSKYIQSPQVDINIAEFRSQKVHVLGQVNKAGVQYLTNIPLTLLDAVNLAGGLAENADWNKVILTRNGIKETISLRALLNEGDIAQNQLLENGDVIYVSNNDTLKVFVMGEVAKPNVLKIDSSGMSLTEALGKAGDIDRVTAKASGIFVIRSLKTKHNEMFEGPVQSNKKIAAIYQLNIKDATALVMGTEFHLQPYDIVYVTSTPVARWNRVISQLLPTITGLNSITETTRYIKDW